MQTADLVGDLHSYVHFGDAGFEVTCATVPGICSRCDRGQRYCSAHCAQVQRRRSVREEGRRYQRTPLGARNNAARQKRWRLRLPARESADDNLRNESSLSRGSDQDNIQALPDPMIWRRGWPARADSSPRGASQRRSRSKKTLADSDSSPK